jgi:hypothetical protein
MSGETDLNKLLATMRPELRGGTYVFVKLLSKSKTPLKELTRSRKFQQPALANLWKSSGKSDLRKRMAGHMALMPRAVTR